MAEKQKREIISLTDDNIRYAVDAWVNTQALAESEYGHISGWDTSNITDMSHLFFDKRKFNDDISKWNVSKVSNMHGMFEYAQDFNQPIGKWNVSNVTYMGYMFAYATTFNQPINKWDVSNVIDMNHMFYNAPAFNEDISNWILMRGIHKKNMFEDTEWGPVTGYKHHEPSVKASIPRIKARAALKNIHEHTVNRQIDRKEDKHLVELMLCKEACQPKFTKQNEIEECEDECLNKIREKYKLTPEQQVQGNPDMMRKINEFLGGKRKTRKSKKSKTKKSIKKKKKRATRKRR